MLPAGATNPDKASSASTRSQNDEGHPQNADRSAHQIPPGRSAALDHPEPENGRRDVDSAIRRIRSAGRGRMEREEPGESRERERRRDQKPGRAALPKPEIGKKTADDLRESGE